MFEKPFPPSLGLRIISAATFGSVLAVLGGIALAAQDKYTARLPNGLAFSDFRGYENWQLVSVSQTDDRLKVMLANPTMIAAYQAGIPGNGKKFPDGAKMAKIQWKPKKSAEAQFPVNVPDNLADLFFMEKDSKRFPATGGWGYAQFDYDAPSDTFTPNKDGTPNCGNVCHTAVVAKDYIFHPYQKR
jgi:hypothetical protein